MTKFWKYHLDHVLFWLVTVSFHLYTSSSLISTAGWWLWLLEVFLRNALLALIIYAHLMYFLPGLIQHRNVLRYVAGLAGSLIFYILVKNTHDVFLTVYTGTTALPFWRYSFYNFSIALFYLAFSAALQLSKAWYLQRERVRQLEVEKLTTELDYLKAQINPHFLFNSLNSIFFQIDKENNTARETVAKFADMLRYQLYECKGEWVSLERELTYLRSFVDLQRLRKDDRYRISLETSGDLRDVQVAPLLMMPLVENAFKHLSHLPENNVVEIRVSRESKSLTMEVTNTYQQRAAGEAGGIGLANLERRLELQYPGRYALILDKNKHVHTATLTLHLE
jgi:sensor histidine kinase YesM